MLIKCKNNKILKKYENKMRFFILPIFDGVIMDNGWAFNTVIVVDTSYTLASTTQNIGCPSTDTINDGQNTKSNLLFTLSHNVPIIVDIKLYSFLHKFVALLDLQIQIHFYSDVGPCTHNKIWTKICSIHKALIRFLPITTWIDYNINNLYTSLGTQ